MNCPVQHRDQVLLYLAGVLEPEQEQVLEEHLETNCPVCAAYLAEAEAALASLATALSPTEPCPEVRERLMARIRQGQPRDEGQDQDEPARQQPQPRGTVRKGHRNRLARMSPALLVTAAAVAITAMVLLVPLRTHRARIAELERELVEQGEAFVQEQSRLKQISHSIAGRGSLIESFYSSATHFFSFSSDDENYADAVARMLWDQDKNVCHFFVRELRPPDEGKAYHLWLITEEGKMVRAGEFTTSEPGGMHFEFELPSVGDTFTQAAVCYDDAAEGMHDTADLAETQVLRGSLKR